jgi:glycerol-3-phosphate cytidylyltransferase
MYEIGYTTGTFDLVHQGHFEILKKCKIYCKYLIVGLVSDALGEKQKRKPVMDYGHRKSILENCKYVDTVVKFRGTSKQEDYKKLKFNVLFIADEYYQCQEYSSFEKDYPTIPVLYFPRTSDVSSSDIYKKILAKVISNIEIKAKAISGDILSLEWKKGEKFIIKPVRISSREINNTANNYQLSNPPPRNWKIPGLILQPRPFISGVNGNRELVVFELLKHKPWYPVLYIEKKKGFNTTIINNVNNIELMNEERKYSEYIYWLVQKDGGETLDVFLKSKPAVEREYIYLQIKEIIKEMNMLGILHMDLHPRNILCNHEGEISIIDFGWVMYKYFDMDDEERCYYNKSLMENFDLYHFRESLVYTGLEKSVPVCLL